MLTSQDLKKIKKVMEEVFAEQFDKRFDVKFQENIQVFSDQVLEYINAVRDTHEEWLRDHHKWLKNHEKRVTKLDKMPYTS